jgi:hypothetical protein
VTPGDVYALLITGVVALVCGIIVVVIILAALMLMRSRTDQQDRDRGDDNVGD